MRRTPALLATLAALAVGGCGGDEGYPNESVEAFVSACTRQPNASEESCRCVIRELEETMPFEEFERADEAVRENREPPQGSAVKIQAAAERCR